MQALENPVIIRKRIIPQEETELKADELLYCDGERKLIVTRWFPIKPRKDVGWGYSVYVLRKNYKMNVFFDRAGNFKYIYCDIVCSEERDGRIVVTDLLLDVTRNAAGRVRILDEKELKEAEKKHLLPVSRILMARQTAAEVIGLLENPEYEPLCEIRESGIEKIDPPAGFVPEAAQI